MRTDRPELIGVGANSWVGHVLGTLGCYTEGQSPSASSQSLSAPEIKPLQENKRFKALCEKVNSMVY